MKTITILLVALLFSHYVRAVDVIINNSTNSFYLLNIEDTGWICGVDARATVKLDNVPDSLLLDGSGGLLFNYSLQTQSGEYIVGTNQTAPFIPATIYIQIGLTSDPYLPSLNALLSDRRSAGSLWSTIWTVFSLGVGCMVVPATLSMAIRAIRRGLTHNIEPT